MISSIVSVFSLETSEEVGIYIYIFRDFFPECKDYPSENICIHTYSIYNTSALMYIQTLAYTCTNIHIYTYTFTTYHIHTYIMHICTCIHTCSHINLYMHTRLCSCIFIYRHADIDTYSANCRNSQHTYIHAYMDAYMQTHTYKLQIIMCTYHIHNTLAYS